ncbi:MAG: hypothetical protein Q7R77_01255 [Candidatus Daviesbacteria bacterium]|nr:hypothetical protein [Candidatus Daviesbacteria bacterium]
MNNRFVRTLKLTIVTFASVHLLLLFAYYLISGQIENLNLFNILDLNLFFPKIGTGLGSFILSFLLVILVYSLFFLIGKGKHGHKHS